jgi:GntR family transcriptional regulator
LKAENAIARDHRPIYIRVAETLRARILSGYYTDMLDGEIKLAREWRVSRRTIQQAVEILAQEGLIERQQGAGTFINSHGVARRYRAITSITASIRAQGLEVSYRILASGIEKADQSAIAFFGLGASADVYRHIRLVIADGRPVAVANTRLNAGLLEGIELSQLNRGLYDTLRGRFGRTVVCAEDSYLPVVADIETTRLLKLAENTAIYLAERRAYDQSGAPIELSTISLAPVPLEISIAQTGVARPVGPVPPKEPWEYRISFGDFRK